MNLVDNNKIFRGFNKIEDGRDNIVMLLDGVSNPSLILESSVLNMHADGALKDYRLFILDAYVNDNIDFISEHYNISVKCAPFTIIEKNGHVETYAGLFNLEDCIF